MPGKGRQQQRGPQGPEFTIHLNCVPEKRPEDPEHRYVKAVALVTHRSGNPPLPLPTGQYREVDFLVDYRSVGRQTLGPDGGARIVRGPIVDAGAYVFRAHLVGTPYWSDPVVFDTETKPEEEEAISAKPDKFEARAIGGDGRYTISVMIADSDNRPVKGALVEVYDEKHDPHLVFRGRTTKDGVLEDEPKVSFTEPFRTFIVQTPGFESRRLTLTGPGRKRPPRTPEPTPGQLEGSLWDVIRNARQHALMDLRAASGRGEPEVLAAEYLRLEEQFAEQRRQEAEARERRRVSKDAFKMQEVEAKARKAEAKAQAKARVAEAKAAADARKSEARAASSARKTEAQSGAGVKKSEQKTERRRESVQAVRDLFQSFLGWLGARRRERHERRDKRRTERKAEEAKRKAERQAARDRQKEKEEKTVGKKGKRNPNPGPNPDPELPPNMLMATPAGTLALPRDRYPGKRQPPDQRR